jgi:hypothetical protein
MHLYPMEETEDEFSEGRKSEFPQYSTEFRLGRKQELRETKPPSKPPDTHYHLPPQRRYPGVAPPRVIAAVLEV